MARVKLIGVLSAGLVCTAFVTWSALPSRSPSANSSSPRSASGLARPSGSQRPPAQTPSGAPGSPYESAGDTLSAGRTPPDASGRPEGTFSSEPENEGSWLSGVLAFALPPRSETVPADEATASSAPSSGRVALVPSRETPELPAPGRESKRTVAALAKADRSNPKASGASIAAKHAIEENEPVVDPDADWYAPAPDDVDAVAPEGYAQLTGRVRAPKREASAGGDWYDSLGERVADESPANGGGADWFDPGFGAEDAAFTGDGLTFGGDGRPMAAAGTELLSTPANDGAVSGDSPFGGAPRTVAPRRYRLVTLVPAKAAERRAAGAMHGASAPAVSPVSPVALPALADAISGEPGVTVASLGPKLPGAGSDAFPGLSAPQPSREKKPAPRFCPIGSVEKKTKKERWCARSDKGGVSFREGPVVLYHPSGKKRAAGSYVNGQLHGAFVEYSAGGRKIGEGAYKKGRKNGPWVFWWENGRKQSEGSFVAGDRTGVWTYYDEKGRKSSQGAIRTVHKVEKKEGRWVFWHPNGRKAQEGVFENGRKTGVWKSFDEKGRTLVASRHGEEIE